MMWLMQPQLRTEKSNFIVEVIRLHEKSPDDINSELLKEKWRVKDQGAELHTSVRPLVLKC